MSASVTAANDIPSSFTASVDRPFEPVGVRELTSELFKRDNQRLTDEQVKQLIANPQIQTNANSRIEKLSATANADAQSEFEEEKIYNLSLRQLASRTTTTVHDILDDLVTFNRADGVRGFLQIFIQGDRLMYVGLIVIVFVFLVMLMKSGDSKGDWLKQHSSSPYHGGCSRCH